MTQATIIGIMDMIMITSGTKIETAIIITMIELVLRPRGQRNQRGLK
jgi:hypothetical protein